MEVSVKMASVGGGKGGKDETVLIGEHPFSLSKRVGLPDNTCVLVDAKHQCLSRKRELTLTLSLRPLLHGLPQRGDEPRDAGEPARARDPRGGAVTRDG